MGEEFDVVFFDVVGDFIVDALENLQHGCVVLLRLLDGADDHGIVDRLLVGIVSSAVDLFKVGVEVF